MTELQSRYLELLKDSLLGSHRPDRICYMVGDKIVGDADIKSGWFYLPSADTMLGLKRLNNIQACVLKAIENNIEGDLIEAGVWRGGATILMRGILKALDITDRNVWVADSFCGFPTSEDCKYEIDKKSHLHQVQAMNISVDSVKHAFSKYYDLLDDQVKFLEGFFKDTLPVAPIEKLAVLRIDGDLYESTMDCLVNLYPKLSKGGYCIIDDYNSYENCKNAVDDFRRENKITEEIHLIDWTGIYWKKLN
jgi:O-methyltransferase